MMRLLDTNTCIYFLNRTSERLVAQFKKYSPSELKLASIPYAICSTPHTIYPMLSFFS